MGTVRLWLSVYEKLCPSGKKRLWTREMVTDFPPRAGDHIHLSVDEEGDSSTQWRIRTHYWEYNGSYACELTNMIVDPDEKASGLNNRDNYAASWWSDEMGRPESTLQRGGWITWEEWNRSKEEAASVGEMEGTIYH